MTDPRPIHGGVDPVRSTGETRKTAADPARGAAFQDLLDRLRSEAQDLRGASESKLEAADLPGAVDRAHATLRDALSLSDRLLEAYRAKLHGGEAGGTSGEDAS